jgi:hypothetical protein
MLNIEVRGDSPEDPYRIGKRLLPPRTVTAVWPPHLTIDITACLVQLREPHPLLIMPASEGTASPRR